MRLLLLAAFCAAAAPAAAGVTVTSELNRPQIGMNEQLVLTVTVAGDQASLPSPKLPPMDAFNVYDSGTSQSLNFINGHMSSSVVYTYVLAPRSAGKFQIPPITADGAAPSAPLSVEVVGGAAAAAAQPATAANPASSPAPPAPAPGSVHAPRGRTGRAADIFVTASLDRPRAYVNQQVTLTVRFMSAAQVQLIGNASYDPPKMTGFLSEELSAPRPGSVVIDGRQYNFTEIKVALFPVQPGPLTIGPAAVHCQIARMSGGTGDNFFDRFFAMSAPEPVTVNSEPLTLQVDALPAGKPDGFTGIVGRLKASAATDRTEVKAGDAVNLTVSVSGTGNVKSIPEPKKPELPSLRFFETESSATVDKTNDRIGGTKTFRTVVVPRVTGSVRLPPFAFSYFDPERKAYARAETESIALRVSPGAPGSAPAANAPSPAAPGSPPSPTTYAT